LEACEVKRFRVIGVYEANDEPVSLIIPAEDEGSARDRAATERIRVDEIHLDDGAPPTATFVDTLLYAGFGGAIIVCVATVGLAIYSFAGGNVLGGLLYFPLGFLMAAANAAVFQRVLDLSARIGHEK
jgi:hypothetical protein